METNILAPWEQFGLIGLMIGAICFLLFTIIKWTLKTTKEILDQAAKEREAWRITMDKQHDTIEKINASIDGHDQKANDRGRYNREEHERIIRNLDEQAKVLDRINRHSDHK